MRRMSGILVVAILMGVAGAGEVGWRTDGTGRYPDAKPPVTFSPTENIVWATPMPSWSNASPVVIEDRIFVCAEPDTLLAVDKRTGKILWRKANPLGEAGAGTKSIPTHPHNGYASATPVSDGERVFAVYGTGVVVAYDIDGKPLWTRLMERPAHPWGHSSSPLLVGGKLLVHIESLVALDPVDGRALWRQAAEKPENPRKKRWGSPVAARLGDADVVITIAGNVIRVSDGKILFGGLAALQFSSPLVVDGIVYFVSMAGARAVRLPADVDGAPEVLWSAKTTRDRYYGSPLLHDGLIYAITRKGFFSAFDAKTGVEVYREKLLLAKTEKNANAAYTSVTLGGEALYFAGMDGSIVVVEPGRKYVELARNTVEESLRSNPVFEGSRLYVRAPGKLYCFGE